MTDTIEPTRHRKSGKKRHIFMWIFIAMQLLFTVWLITGIVDAQAPAYTGPYNKDAELGEDVGTAIAAWMIIVVWTLADLVMLGIYGIVKLVRR